MGLLEPITHSEEIESLLNEAKSRYESAEKKMNSQKEKTAKALEQLGKAKVVLVHQNGWICPHIPVFCQC